MQELTQEEHSIHLGNLLRETLSFAPCPASKNQRQKLLIPSHLQEIYKDVIIFPKDKKKALLPVVKGQKI